MQSYISWLEGQSRLVRIITTIWVLDILWAVYRIGRAVVAKNWLHMILGIIWVIAAGTVGWILDLIWMILFDRIFWFGQD